MADPLTKNDERFLLSLVDNPHSDYDDNDEVEGYPNYHVDFERQVLLADFYEPETGDKMHGEWLLTFDPAASSTTTQDLRADRR